MTKTTMNMTIDNDIAEIIKNRYPGKVSALVEDFLRNLLNLGFTDELDKNKSEILKELSESESSMAYNRSRVKILNQKLKVINEQEQQVLDENISVIKAGYFELNQEDRSKFSDIYNIVKKQGALPRDDMLTNAYYAYVLKNRELEFKRMETIFDYKTEKFEYAPFMSKVTRCSIFTGIKNEDI